MIIITIARKPITLSTTQNILTYGTGGLNINEGRIRIETEDRKRIRSGAGFSTGTASLQGIGRSEGIFTAHSQGRWPANIILQHRTDCRIIGARDVKGGSGTFCSHWPEHCRGHGFERCLAGDTQHGAPPPGWTPPARTETIPVWECGQDCPVANMDNQSGQSTTPSSVTRGAGKSSVTTFLNHKRYEDVPCHGDSGGASRFFKQIQS